MIVPDELLKLARAQAHRRKLWHKRGPMPDTGWNLLGCGHFGVAYEHPDYPGFALKVSGNAGFGGMSDEGKKQADCWPTFAQHCHKNPHPNLPQILHFERINASTCWAIMPEYAGVSWNETNAEANLRYEWAAWIGGAPGAPEWLWPIIGMKSALNMRVDLHVYNVMRNAEGTLILTDPFSFLEDDL